MAGITPNRRAAYVNQNFGVHPPAERWLVVTATTPDDDTLGIEIDAPGYERQPVTFAESTHGETESTNLVMVTTADRSLSDAAGVEVWTAKEGGERVYYAALTVGMVDGDPDSEETVMTLKPGTITYEFLRDSPHTSTTRAPVHHRGFTVSSCSCMSHVTFVATRRNDPIARLWSSFRNCVGC